MSAHPLAGKVAPCEYLINVPGLISAYYTHQPDPENSAHQVAFGTSGNRGTSLDNSSNEAHILAISQAISEMRNRKASTALCTSGLQPWPGGRPGRWRGDHPIA
jgi:phosphoglucomutase